MTDADNPWRMTIERRLADLERDILRMSAYVGMIETRRALGNPNEGVSWPEDPADRARLAKEKLARGEPVKVVMVHAEQTPDGPISTEHRTMLVKCPYCEERCLLRDPSGRTPDLAQHIAATHMPTEESAP